MPISGQRYKVTANTGSPPEVLEGALWWAGGGPYYYIPAGSGVGEQLATETGDSNIYYLTLAAAQARFAVFSLVGAPPWL